MTYADFYNQYINKKIDIDDVSKYQCVDISKAYAKYVWVLAYTVNNELTPTDG